MHAPSYLGAKRVIQAHSQRQTHAVISRRTPCSILEAKHVLRGVVRMECDVSGCLMTGETRAIIRAHTLVGLQAMPAMKTGYVSVLLRKINQVAFNHL